MDTKVRDRAVEDVWIREFAGTHHCVLCGNYGAIDTRGKVFTPAGHECGDKVWCICPNGRKLKEITGLDRPPEEQPTSGNDPRSKLVD